MCEMRPTFFEIFFYLVLSLKNGEMHEREFVNGFPLYAESVKGEGDGRMGCCGVRRGRERMKQRR